MTGSLTSLRALSKWFTGLVNQGVSRGGNESCVCVRVCVCKVSIRQHSYLHLLMTPPIRLNRPRCYAPYHSLALCVCALKKEARCCRAVAAVTNLPGPPDGNRSKVTELWLDKHRSPASISYPVHFGNTWLFLVTLDQRKNIEAEGVGRKGQKR